MSVPFRCLLPIYIPPPFFSLHFPHARPYLASHIIFLRLPNNRRHANALCDSWKGHGQGFGVRFSDLNWLRYDKKVYEGTMCTFVTRMCAETVTLMRAARRRRKKSLSLRIGSINGKVSTLAHMGGEMKCARLYPTPTHSSQKKGHSNIQTAHPTATHRFTNDEPLGDLDSSYCCFFLFAHSEFVAYLRFTGASSPELTVINPPGAGWDTGVEPERKEK